MKKNYLALIFGVFLFSSSFAQLSVKTDIYSIYQLRNFYGALEYSFTENFSFEIGQEITIRNNANQRHKNNLFFIGKYHEVIPRIEGSYFGVLVGMQDDKNIFKEEAFLFQTNYSRSGFQFGTVIGQKGFYGERWFIDAQLGIYQLFYKDRLAINEQSISPPNIDDLRGGKFGGFIRINAGYKF